MVLGDQTGRPHHELKDIELALKIGGYLARLPAHQSATACELAEAFHGLGYPLADMIAAYRVCEQLRQEQVLVRGRNGYGYRLSS